MVRQLCYEQHQAAQLLYDLHSTHLAAAVRQGHAEHLLLLLLLLGSASKGCVPVGVAECHCRKHLAALLLLLLRSYCSCCAPLHYTAVRC
jgi:hypothetical protein